MTSTHPLTQIEQVVAILQPLPRHEQCKIIAQMVFDGALTAAQGKDVLYELSAAELGVSAHGEPSMWQHLLQSAKEHGTRD